MSAHRVWGDHCTCSRQTVATAQVFSVGRGFLQARSDRTWEWLVWFGGPGRHILECLTPAQVSLTAWLGSWSPGGGRKHLRQETQVLWCRQHELTHWSHTCHTLDIGNSTKPCSERKKGTFTFVVILAIVSFYISTLAKIWITLCQIPSQLSATRTPHSTFITNS